MDRLRYQLNSSEIYEYVMATGWRREKFNKFFLILSIVVFILCIIEYFRTRFVTYFIFAFFVLIYLFYTVYIRRKLKYRKALKYFSGNQYSVEFQGDVLGDGTERINLNDSDNEVLETPELLIIKNSDIMFGIPKRIMTGDEQERIKNCKAKKYRIIKIERK